MLNDLVISLQAANLLGGNAVKENELLARAGIKPRAALGGTGRTALSNLSNRAAIGAKLTGKPSTAAIDKEVGFSKNTQAMLKQFRYSCRRAAWATRVEN